MCAILRIIFLGAIIALVVWAFSACSRICDGGQARPRHRLRLVRG